MRFPIQIELQCLRMICYSNLEQLYDLLAEIFFFGFSQGFSSTFIEERISNSQMFQHYLDRGDDSFLDNLGLKEMLSAIYPIDIMEDDLHHINTICMWLGEAYLRLYFKYHRSMSFLFLYLSLEKMSQMFSVYHEMDWTQLYQYFETLIDSKSMLSLLLKSRKMTAYQLSALSGISYQTIKNYTRSNRNIYNASFANISKISFILDVDIHMFDEQLPNVVDGSFLDLQIKDMVYLSFYGYHIVSYFDEDIGKGSYTYDAEHGMLTDSRHYIKAIVPRQANNQAIQLAIEDFLLDCKVFLQNVTLIIFIDDELDGFELNVTGFEKAFIITPQSLVSFHQDTYRVKMIPTYLHDSAIRLSQQK